ncbi:MAG: hypothetical protein U9R56_05095, partial [candidate division Zixibacteria bacterium]|nr:hypothetical protein [candidate division Zixibacteria bacterium]
MRGILVDCIVELFHRKILYVFGVITLLGLVSIFSSSSANLEIQGQAIDLEEMNVALGNPVMKGLNVFMYILVFLSVMATAGLVPNMLTKGRVDFYLSKPISRTSLLLQKIIAIWVVYGVIMVISILVEFIVAGLVFGAFGWGIVYVITINLLAFLIWLCVTSFAGVLTGSGGMSIMAAFIIWLAQRIFSYHEAIRNFIDSLVVRYLVEVL